MATLIVQVTDLARRLGLEQPLPDDQQWLLEQSVLDAQADVEAYLGRGLLPVEYTETGLIAWPDGWRLQNAPVIEIISTEAEIDPDTSATTGRFTVVYTAGLDALNDPALEPIRRYVRTHAMNSPEIRALVYRRSPDSGRTVTSLTAEGQSVTYDDANPAAAAGSLLPGAVPSLSSLDRWRLAGRRVYRRPQDPAAAEPWPYGYRPTPWRWW